MSGQFLPEALTTGKANKLSEMSLSHSGKGPTVEGLLRAGGAGHIPKQAALAASTQGDGGGSSGGSSKAGRGAPRAVNGAGMVSMGGGRRRMRAPGGWGWHLVLNLFKLIFTVPL